MLNFDEVSSIREQVRRWKSQNLSIAFVPTMGNLHAGHLALIAKAKSLADKVVVSIYVNPLQFGENEDFDAYPRTLEKDQAALKNAGVDILFLPTSVMIYPDSPSKSTQVLVPGISNLLCGEFRPDHFSGVATVVCKLLNIVQANIAVFGEKDFQQVAVIRKMVRDLFIPVQIKAAPTVRESDGLALSSRNQYLSNEQRKTAAKLYQAMTEMLDNARNGIDYRDIEMKGREKLKKSGFKPEYVQLSNRNTLLPAETLDKNAVLLVAAWLGKTRLIDNLSLSNCTNNN